MKALVKTGKGPGLIEVQEREIPKLRGDDWVLIKVKAAGVCGTDLHIWHDQFPYWPPVILGHEFCGEIVEVGKAVQRFRVGDRVVAEPHSLACGVCDLCRNGNIQLCAHKRSPGWGIDGAFAEYVTMPEMLLHPVPASLSDEVAALAEPMAIAVHQVTERCRIECQDFVVVTGAGPIGILAAFVAKAVGAGTVLLTGVNSCEQVRFPVAREMGADVIVNVEREDPVSIVLDRTGGRGADVVIETSGASPAINQGIELVKKCGRICAIGLSEEEATPIAWKKLAMKSIDVAGCMSSSYSSWDKALNLMARTDRDLGKLITHRTGIDHWERVFEDLISEKGIKAVFTP